MADYRKLVPFILKHEGGFVNDPLDRGNETNKGVTFATWQTYCKKKGKVATVESLKNISDEDWGAIFKEMYWDRFKADEIKDQSVANILVDWLWASGIHAIKHLQRIVGVTDDGIVGKHTIFALNEKYAPTLFDDIKQDRIAFVNNIVKRNPSQKRFIKGWTNRINDFKYEYTY